MNLLSLDQMPLNAMPFVLLGLFVAIVPGRWHRCRNEVRRQVRAGIMIVRARPGCG